MVLKAARKIILVSSGQPSLNPRLVKEADTLSDAGYEVTIFYAYWNDWGTEYDKKILASSKWKAIRIGGSPTAARFTYLMSRVLHKIAGKINSPRLFTAALSRPSLALRSEIKKHRADLYIAHNLGALPAVIAAAKKHNKPCGFDAEDFHRNEVTDDPNNADVKRKAFVENKYLPQVTYLTASSPQIAAQYAKLFPMLSPVVILNVFRKSNVEVRMVQRPLKLFWFSQTVGSGRGIEDVVAALSKLNKSDFELHVLGHRPAANDNFYKKITTSHVNVKFHDPIPPDDVIQFAAQFDIGLALEPGFSLNNNIALSNKLFTYMQAGLAVIASETAAQLAFMQQNKRIGATYPIGNVEVLCYIINDYHQHPQKLKACREASLRLAHEQYNWEAESAKFLNLIKATL